MLALLFNSFDVENPFLWFAISDFHLEVTMISLSDAMFRLLYLLCREPWLTAQQLAIWTNRSLSRLYADLDCLLQHQFVQRVNPRCADLDVHFLYAITDRAVKFLAERRGMDERALRQEFQATRTRHLEILWRIEAVWAVREFLLGLGKGEYAVQSIGTLEREAFSFHMQQKVIQFHGRARLEDANDSALRVVVEWDNERVRVDRKRLFMLAEWSWQFHDWEPAPNVPTVLVVLANHARLNELWDMVNSHMEFAGPLHSTLLLTTTERLYARGAFAPIWLSVARNEWQTLTAQQYWLPKEECEFYVLRDMRSGRIGKFSFTGKNLGTLATSQRLLHLNLTLSAQAKRVLRRIATRPLLSVEQLAWLMHEHPDRVSKALHELARANLVKPITHHRTRRYVLTSFGTQYEAAEAGFGRGVKRYLKASGGRSGVNRLVFHLEHTIAANDFFLAWVRLARERGVEFEWFSEIESARYFKYGSVWHRFLPDGRGVWHGKGEPFRFVVEMDRTRESATNLAAKFNEYFYWQMHRMSQRGEEENPNVLVVTTSWTQGETIARLMKRARRKIFPRYPLWVTTFEMLQAHGIHGQIWKSNERATGLQRLPCFE